MSDLYSRYAARVSFDPAFLGNQLGVYQMLHALTDAALADRLGCEVPVLTHLRMCGAVRPDHFNADVAEVAVKFGVRAEVLGEICRG